MMHPITTEVVAALGEVARRYPGHPDGAYALPWYLLLGDPRSGRSSALRAMHLDWSHGDRPIALPVPDPFCAIWMPAQAVIVEPGDRVLGDNAHRDAFPALCAELRLRRPRESVDGIILVLDAVALMDLSEQALDAYAARQRAYLVEAAKHLAADVPTYVVVTRYDTLYGFADVFAWTPERRTEEPFGFTLPLGTDSQAAGERIREELRGLSARFEAMCFAKISSDDPPDQRARAFQHLAEAALLSERLASVLSVVAMASAYERAPWLRALIVGSAVPGVGDRPRALATRFTNMGLVLPQELPRAARPGGLPLLVFFTKLLLPERDVVPTKKRFRDDPLSVWTTVAGCVLLVVAVLVAVAFVVLEKTAH